jgi:hypothetical protein
MSALRDPRAVFTRLIALAACVVAIAACGTSSGPVPNVTPSPISTGRPTDGPGPTATVESSPTALSAEIEVLVIGGDFEGAYRAVAAEACMSAPAQNTFAVAYASAEAADGFVALDLVLRDAAQAQEDATSAYSLQLSLDGADGGVSYSLDPAAGNGEGDAFLDVSPTDATLDLSVTAPDESIIDLTVICD